jgi:FkbM family methyltransferase
MKERIESLRAQVLRAAVAPEPTIDGLKERPVFLMGVTSEIATMHGQRVVESCERVIAGITDVSGEATIFGVPVWTSEEFLKRAKQYPGAIAIDFASDLNGRGWVAMLCEQTGVERCDCVMVQAQLGLHAVYEAVTTYRRRTLERLDDFLKIADRLDDDFSRLTLFGNLLFRLTYDRNHIVRSSPADEYFSGWSDASTFHLGTREHFVDCGAYQGPIVQKFLGATGYRYESITAFEPDRINFEKLQKVSPHPLHDYRPVNKAVSSKRQKLKFKETGTMSSYVSDDGGVVVETVRLDDELDKLTFLKMDVEGFETDALKGAQRLLNSQRPRAAVCVYHYAHCLVRVMEQFDAAVDDYHFRLRQHFGGYYYDLVLYASPVSGLEPPALVA